MEPLTARISLMNLLVVEMWTARLTISSVPIQSVSTNLSFAMVKMIVVMVVTNPVNTPVGPPKYLANQENGLVLG